MSVSHADRRTMNLRRRIRFSDCDPAGIVFYPQYFVMFNDLLEQWVDSLIPDGFAGWVIERRLGLPTVHLDARFERVSRMGDDVDLSLEVVRVGHRSIVLKLHCRGVDGAMRMSMTQTVVTTSLDSHAAIPVPAVLMAALGAPAHEASSVLESVPSSSENQQP